MFRWLLYSILRRAEGGLRRVSDEETHIKNNKHVLAYVSGMGFGVMSGAFSLVDVLADSVGPGTMELRGKKLDFPFFTLLHSPQLIITTTSQLGVFQT
ncbi:hypothetical protein B566_EDAN002347 [Ephemera danica]|nr:hypothetical protein B566_EDAN002347 [Ephemera danica]